MQHQPGLPLISRRTENLAIYVMLIVLATISLVILPTLVSVAEPVEATTFTLRQAQGA